MAEDSYSFALLLFMLLLFAILYISYLLRVNNITTVHESIISTIIGIFVGLVIHLTPGDTRLQRVVTFDHRYFFNLILPPIILYSGYNLKTALFFKNFGLILTFALLGTIISSLIIGLSVYLFSLTGIHDLHFSFLDSIVFGSILSSTDPVTILAIFDQLKIDKTLHAIIFGESILNDAVAIVLFSTLHQFREIQFTTASFFNGILTFIGVFLGSIFVGIIIALLCAIMLKHTKLYRFPSIESCLVSLLAFLSYLIS